MAASHENVSDKTWPDYCNLILDEKLLGEIVLFFIKN